MTGDTLTEKLAVVVNCDPGWDDLILLCFLASLDKQVEVGLVWSVHGNRDAQKTFANLVGLVEALGLSWNTYLGGSMPQIECANPPTWWIDGAQPELETSIGNRNADQPEFAPSILERFLDQTSTRPTLIATGPLSEISRLAQQRPSIFQRLAQTIVVGGALGSGNVSEHAEFNFYMDALAANHVLNVVPNVTLIPLEECAKIRFDLRDLREIQTSTLKGAEVVSSLALRYIQRFGNGLPHASVADLAALLYLLRPDWFNTYTVAATVDCSNGSEHGKLNVQAGDRVRIAAFHDAPPSRFWKEILTS